MPWKPETLTGAILWQPRLFDIAFYAKSNYQKILKTQPLVHFKSTKIYLSFTADVSRTTISTILPPAQL